MKFSDIKAYEDLKEKLLSGFHSGKMHHAQLFIDQAGGASLAMSLAYAQYILCENKTNTDSCGVCSGCLKNTKLMHPDVHYTFPFFINKEKGFHDITAFYTQWREALRSNPFLNDVDWITSIDGENKQAKITAVECQSLVHRVNMKSFEGGPKIFIIWMPEEADKEINIILKSLEEPPPNTYFFLINFNKDVLLNTIISRCQTWRMRSLISDEVIEIAHNENSQLILNQDQMFAIEPIYNEVLKFAKQQSEESLDAEKWLKNCFQNKMFEIVESTDFFSKRNREEQKLFYTSAMNILSKWITDDTFYTKAFPQKTKIDHEKLYSAIREIEKAYYHTERNCNTKMQYISSSIMIKNLGL